jgi:hypothetical protein
MIGFHAYPTGGFGPFSADPTSFAGMFAYVDAFIDEVQAVSALARVRFFMLRYSFAVLRNTRVHA